MVERPDPTKPFDPEAYRRWKQEQARQGPGDMRRAIPGQRQLDLSLVEVGWWLRSLRRHALGADHLAEIGGVVVEKLPGGVSSEGEIIPDRFRTLNVGAPALQRWQILDADEVDLDTLPGVDRHSATIAALWLIRQIPQTRKVLHPTDLSCLRDAHRLASAVTV